MVFELLCSSGSEEFVSEAEIVHFSRPDFFNLLDILGSQIQECTVLCLHYRYLCECSHA